MNPEIPVIAGVISTVIFVLSTLPMLWKAARTRDLASYSFGNIALSNLGNLVHSLYVFSLPMGPIWVLHSFYLVATGLMMFWYLRYRPRHAVDAFDDADELRTERWGTEELQLVG